MWYMPIVINILLLLLKKIKSESPCIFQIIHRFDSYICKKLTDMVFSRNHLPE